jgi:integrase
MHEINVTVVRYADRPNLVLAYTDEAGRRRTRSAGTAELGEAWRAAKAWEEELRGTAGSPLNVSWVEFRRRYRTEHLAALAPKTARKAGYCLDRLQRFLNPQRLADVTAACLSAFQAELRGSQASDGEAAANDTTIASILRHIRAALAWGVSMGLLDALPAINMPRRARGRKMKGGSLTAEQFDRLLAAVPRVRQHDAPAWIRYLTGVWLSGLRLEESLILRWDVDSAFVIDLSGRRPRFRIRGEAQKSGRDELLPMTPDFAQFILQTPEDQRQGPVFGLVRADNGKGFSAEGVGRRISAIGAAAGVLVGGKAASAHDLRRSFGTRWARRVMPAVLQRLMRHASIATTMTYYVDLDADEMADELWAAEEMRSRELSLATN